MNNINKLSLLQKQISRLSEQKLYHQKVVSSAMTRLDMVTKELNEAMEELDTLKGIKLVISKVPRIETWTNGDSPDAA